MLPTLDFDLPISLERPFRRFARRSKRFRATWQTIAETETTARAAQAIMASLMHEAVALISDEEGCWCLYGYVTDLLELTDHAISEALSEALVQNELATFKDERWFNRWENRSGSYFSWGEFGVARQYVTLTAKGKAWAAQTAIKNPLL